VIPVADGWVIADINVGILFIFADLLAGSLRRHHGRLGVQLEISVPGALRSAAQMVSYEVSIGFVIVTVLLCAGSLNLTGIVLAQEHGIGTCWACRLEFLDWHWLPLFPMFIVFFISALAETNRPPFDLPEAESELVAGFMVEYGSTPYMMFMLGEYVAIALMCALMTILFLGGWLPPSTLHCSWVPGVVWFIAQGVCSASSCSPWSRRFVPRYRYDQLMRLGWKVFLPLSLAMVFVVATVLMITGWAPGRWSASRSSAIGPPACWLAEVKRG
jgi:NADH-quinone oxidoreductase subunit H